jgi:hypothetical protein
VDSSFWLVISYKIRHIIDDQRTDVNCYTVWLLFSAELVFQAIEIYLAWLSLGSGWGNIETILYFPVGSSALCALIGLVTSAAHVFYCQRIIALGKNYVIPAVVALVCLGSFR